MTVDNSKLLYSSEWDIDQLVTTDEVAATGAGTTTLYTTTATDPPEFEVQFKPTGFGAWFSAGSYSTSPGVSLSTFYAYWDGSILKAHTSEAGTLRYFVWADKVTN